MSAVFILIWKYIIIIIITNIKAPTGGWESGDKKVLGKFTSFSMEFTSMLWAGGGGVGPGAKTPLHCLEII